MDVEFLEVNVECILKGALVKVKAEGNPGDVIDELKGIDPDAEFRTSFPTRGGNKWNKGRNNKRGKIFSITIKIIRDKKYIDLAVKQEGDEKVVSVGVSSSKKDDFIKGAKEKLGEDGGKLDEDKTVIIPSEQILIEYYEYKDNLLFDSFGSES